MNVSIHKHIKVYNLYLNNKKQQKYIKKMIYISLGQIAPVQHGKDSLSRFLRGTLSVKTTSSTCSFLDFYLNRITTHKDVLVQPQTSFGSPVNMEEQAHVLSTLTFSYSLVATVFYQLTQSLESSSLTTNNKNRTGLLLTDITCTGGQYRGCKQKTNTHLEIIFDHS